MSKLIQDCMNEVKNNEAMLNFVCEKIYPISIYPLDIKPFSTRQRSLDFEYLYDHEKIVIIMAFLSRTPDGKAVIPFLDIKFNLELVKLDEYLFTHFTNSLRLGKTFDEALEITNQIYLAYLVS